MGKLLDGYAACYPDFVSNMPYITRRHVYIADKPHNLIAPSTAWKTTKPKVVINRIYDDPLDGWWAHVNARNVEVVGYVS